MSRGESKTMQRETAEDILNQPDPEEIRQKKRDEMIKNYRERKSRKITDEELEPFKNRIQKRYTDEELAPYMKKNG